MDASTPADGDEIYVEVSSIQRPAAQAPPPIPPRTRRGDNPNTSGIPLDAGELYAISNTPDARNDGIGHLSAIPTVVNSIVDEINNPGYYNKAKQPRTDSQYYNVGAGHNPKKKGKRYNLPDIQLVPVSKVEFERHVEQKFLGEKKESESWLRSIHNSAYLNRVITYFAEEKADLKKSLGNWNIGTIVENFVASLTRRVEEMDSRFSGQLKACGSFYEGVKVKTANEFDYILELKSDGLAQSQLNFKHVNPETFKPRQRDQIRARSYFKIEFDPNNVPQLWTCGKCSGCYSDLHLCEQTDLHPRRLQTEFARMITQCAQEYRGQNGGKHLSNSANVVKVTTSGPAVTLFTKMTEDAKRLLNRQGRSALRKIEEQGHGHMFLIKIDITLAIPVRSLSEQMTWPLEGRGDIEFDRRMHQGHVDLCHLVPAGDFWRVSFSYLETEYMTQHARVTGRKDCFQALKYMRDVLSLSDDHETGLLSTYPLKVTFLKTAHRHAEDEAWGFWNLSRRALEILETVEREGKEGALTSCFIRDDPILMESDRSYLETRRIRQFFQDLQQSYNVSGVLHAFAFVLIILLEFGLMICSLEYLGDYYTKDLPLLESTNCSNASQTRLDLGEYLFGLMPLSFLALLISLIGLVCSSILYCLPTSNPMFRMFYGPLITYGIATAFSSAQVVLSCILTMLYRYLSSIARCHTIQDSVQNITMALIGLSAVFLILIGLHLIIVVCLMKCRCKMFQWEWIFYDHLYFEFISKICKSQNFSPWDRYGDVPTGGVDWFRTKSWRKELEGKDNEVYEDWEAISVRADSLKDGSMKWQSQESGVERPVFDPMP